MSANPSPQSRPLETATYIAELASDLAKLARDHGFSELAYLLDVARLEAEITAGRPETPHRSE
jgi:hypothetical protein